MPKCMEFFCFEFPFFLLEKRFKNSRRHIYIECDTCKITWIGNGTFAPLLVWRWYYNLLNPSLMHYCLLGWQFGACTFQNHTAFNEVTEATIIFDWRETVFGVADGNQRVYTSNYCKTTFGGIRISQRLLKSFLHKIEHGKVVLIRNATIIFFVR